MDGPIPKSEWGDGPWQHEPDELEWVDSSSGYNCRIQRNMHTGSLCGYVGVPESHPAFEIDYSGVPSKEAEVRIKRFREWSRSKEHWNTIAKYTGGEIIRIPGIGDAIFNVEVHGGLTYAGKKDKLWDFGFDCAHAWDLNPAMDALMARQFARKRNPGDKYRDLGYVRKEVTKLAEQLKAMEVYVDLSAYTGGEHEGKE